MNRGASDAFHSIFGWLSDFVTSLGDEPSTTPSHVMRLFRAQLRDCQKAYRDAANVCLHLCPERTGDPTKFVRMMDDLHRGLLAKLFTEIAWCDRKWSRAEKELSIELFKHLWGAKVKSDQLAQSLETTVAHAEMLKWRDLLAPFRDYEPLREKIVEIRGICSRFTHLIASADNDLKSEEAIRLRDLQKEIDNALIITDDATTPQPPVAEVRSTSTQVTQMLQPESPPLDIDDLFTGAAVGGAAAGPPSGRMPPPRRKPKTTSRTASAQEPPIEETPLTDPQADQKTVLNEAFAELRNLVGLKAIKKDVQELVQFLRVQTARRQADLPTAEVSLHSVFCGNPGTGKTTVARILGRIFFGLGLLKRGHTIEADRSRLVAEYAGQTGPRTSEVVDEALDGVLFIDEAYSLVAEKGDDPFGAECVQTLLKRMEDDRSRLVIVLAGYPEPMDRMLRSNPGLKSRFQHTMQFEDYDPKELLAIYQKLCKQHAYKLSEAAQATLIEELQKIHSRRDEHFGNGRTARNLFEKSIRRLASRIINTAPLTRKLLTTIEPADIHPQK